MKILKCTDLGNASCPTEFRAESVDEVLKQAEEHAKSAHNLTVTPELVEKMKGMVKDEPAPAPKEEAPAAAPAQAPSEPAKTDAPAETPKTDAPASSDATESKPAEPPKA